MRIVRFSHHDAIRFGIVDGAELVVLAGDPLFAGFDTTGERVPLGEAALLAPVIPRSKIVCVGKNYRDHAAEMGGEAPRRRCCSSSPTRRSSVPEMPSCARRSRSAPTSRASWPS